MDAGKQALIGICLAAAVCAGCGKKRQPSATREWQDLVGELTNIARIARLNVPGTKIITSYDPTGGNSDRNHYVRKGPEGWWVLADLEGPGYISRFWMTGVPKDHGLRLYFDSARRPRIDTTIDEFFGRTGVFRPPLTVREQNCRCMYMPIPYKERLIVMAEEGGATPDSDPKFYYQINYSSLPSDTLVSEIPAGLSREQSRELAAVERIWNEGDFDELLPDAEILTVELKAGAGATARVPRIEGPATIRKLEITPEFSGVDSAVARENLLRQLILRINWDNAPFPSVEVPVGDFFGSFWRRRRFNSVFLGMEEDTFFARFPMPFEHGAQLSIENESSTDVPVTVAVHYSRGSALERDAGYFHACWRKSGPNEVGRPHTVLDTGGRGKYVGCFLSVVSQDRSWWILEGDETIAVDGESDPSWKGTGLEDYFNGGWYYKRLKVRPLHGLLYMSPFATLQYRFHVSDPVLFDSAFRMEFERGPNHASRGWMESVAYYYMAEPFRAPSRLGTVSERRPPPDPFMEPAFMARVLQRERLGDYDGACEYIDCFLERYPEHESASLLRLRQIGYKARELGFEAVQSEYRKFVEDEEDEKAVDQAKLILWFHDDPDHALLGAYCNGMTTVFVDGKPLVRVDHPEQLAVVPVTLTPGRHTFVLAARSTRQKPWVQACLRTHSGDFLTDTDWNAAVSPEGNYHSPGYDDSSWDVRLGWRKGPPQEPFLKAAPNAFVGMQSKAKALHCRALKDKQNTVIFRKEFTYSLNRDD
ncbi:MAG: glycoside hydrolase family 172 protein [Kiritimatiellia bacterium]